MEKLPVKLLVVLSLVIIGAAGVFALRSPRTSAPDLPIQAAVFPTPEPTPPSVTSIVAPNGEMILKVREETIEGEVRKTFSIFVEESGLQRVIYSEFPPEGSSLDVPYNTFSPDNRYFFLEESGPEGTSYLVFSTAGEDLTQDSENLEVGSLFRERFEDYIVTDITGWGGENLLVVNTDTVNGTEGPSFWFEVPTHAFIRLSNRFN